MFSFFKKKQPFSVRIKEYDSVRLIAGMEITTCRKSMKKDVSQLQKKVQQHQSELRELSNPSGTMVISTTRMKQAIFLTSLEHGLILKNRNLLLL